jgi:hypothetical protein
MHLACWRTRPRDRELSGTDIFSRAEVDKSLFRRDAETSTPEACATQNHREERAILVRPLRSQWQVNRRNHAAGAATAKLNRREFNRDKPRMAAQTFPLVVGQCAISATGKHQ